jgi:hypothetical protein
MVLQPDEYFGDAIAATETLDDLATVLEDLQAAGLAVSADDRLIYVRARVDRIGNLVIHVYPRDHDPPHFHVVGPGISAMFDLYDCSYLGGDLGRYRRDLTEWFFRKGGRERAIAMWKRTRPSDVAS